jgi:hypothetical protein
MEGEISRLRIVAISYSNCGIWPMLASSNPFYKQAVDTACGSAEKMVQVVAVFVCLHAGSGSFACKDWKEAQPPT